MTDDHFDRIIARIDGLQAEMELRFTEIENRLSRIEASLLTLTTAFINHLNDHHRGAA